MQNPNLLKNNSESMEWEELDKYDQRIKKPEKIQNC